MLAASLSTTLLKAVVGRGSGPSWQARSRAERLRRSPRATRPAIAAAAGVTIVLTMMFVRRAQPAPSLCGARRSCVALLVGLDRVLPRACTTSPTSSPASLLGAFWVLARAGRLRPGAARPRPVEPLSHAGAPTSASWRWCSTRSRSRTSTRSARWSSAAPREPRAGRSRPGSRPRSRTRAARWPSAAAVAGAELVIVCGGDGTVRDGVRRARRHRHPRRRRPRRHRQPAGPQPRHPALPAGRARRRAATARTARSTWSGSPATASGTTSTSW